MKISRIVWLEHIVEKLHHKHDVRENEITELFDNKPKFLKKEKGYTEGEDIYVAYGKTNKGRLLSVFFVYTKDQRAIIVSARDMTIKEIKKHAR